MKEFRRSRRREVAGSIHVVDSMTGSVVGQIGNISESGMLVMASAPLTIDALYQLKFDLEPAGANPFEVGAHLLWKDQASAPGQAWVGFRFIAVPDAQRVRLRDWIDAPGSRYV